jgi:2-polyprenyl-6-methoxyphenol hydroxylase-like FAD-dependent oxidoreductase
MPSVRELGVGVNLLPHAVRELTELGLAGELESAALPTAELVMFNKHGQRIWAEPRGIPAGYRWPQYSIHRGRLIRILHDSVLRRLGPDHLSPGRRVVGYSQDATSASLRFADGSSLDADAVVAADGIHSPSRGQMYPREAAPLWNGITMWRAVARGSSFLSGASMAIIGHFGRRVVIYPVTRPDTDRQTLLNVVLEVKTADGMAMPKPDWDHHGDRTQVRALLGHFRCDGINLERLSDTADQWWQYPMVDRDPLPRWSFGRVTLLGDAAHPMYPVGSNGASQAILDGRWLARALALEPTVESALDAYDRERRPTTNAIVLSNRRVGAERCMELAEERAPDGFQRLADVFAPGELESIAAEFKRVAGFDPAVLNSRASLSVTPRGSTNMVS